MSENKPKLKTRCYYTEYVNHMIRFYLTCPETLNMDGKRAADISNWLAVQSVMHHLSDESAQFVVIGEHKLGDTYSVVLIDDGEYAVFEHHVHTCPLVVVLFARLEVFLHGENLTHMDVVLAEEVVVETNEFHLSQS